MGTFLFTLLHIVSVFISLPSLYCPSSPIRVLLSEKDSLSSLASPCYYSCTKISHTTPSSSLLIFFCFLMLFEIIYANVKICCQDTHEKTYFMDFCFWFTSLSTLETIPIDFGYIPEFEDSTLSLKNNMLETQVLEESLSS